MSIQSKPMSSSTSLSALVLSTDLTRRYIKGASILLIMSTLVACEHGASNSALTLTPPLFEEVTTLANSGIIPPADNYGADGISVAENGDVFISGGPLTNSIVRITPEGVVSEFATGFQSANGSDFDSAGNLFVADYEANAIKRVTPDGTVSTFASGLDGPAGVYLDNEDNVIVGLYGADFSGKAATVLRITPDGISSILATGGGLRDVVGVAGDENGDVYAGNYKGRQLYRVTNGNVTLLATASIKINMIDYSRGYIYIANSGQIVRINTSTGEEELVSGTPEQQTVDGPVKTADFVMPTSVAFSPDENILYAVDRVTGDVRKITQKNKTIH